jgi:hypothetical protein
MWTHPFRVPSRTRPPTRGDSAAESVASVLDAPENAPVWNSNLQHDFNVRICDSFDASSSTVLRELDESNRFIQNSAESTSI